LDSSLERQAIRGEQPTPGACSSGGQVCGHFLADSRHFSLRLLVCYLLALERQLPVLSCGDLLDAHGGVYSGRIAKCSGKALQWVNKVGSQTEGPKLVEKRTERPCPL